MTDQEREQVLKMIESGKISPEDGLKLMRTLNQNPAEDEVPDLKTGINSNPPTEAAEKDIKVNPQAQQAGFENDPRIAQVKSSVQRLWQIPLWIGILVTVLSAWGMYTMVRSGNLNFWFFSLTLPLLLGVLITVAAVGSRKARWLFVDIHQKPGERPARIFLGFPLPLKLATWILRTFGRYIPDLHKTTVDDVIQVIETGFTGDEPLVVNVDEGSDGERVQVYIG